MDKEFSKFYIQEKKHYWGIWSNGDKEPLISGMDAVKSNSLQLFEKLQYQLVLDIKEDRDPTINLKKYYQYIETGHCDSELLRIHINLTKNPQDYKSDLIQKTIGLAHNLRSGDTAWYYLTDKDDRQSDYRKLKINEEKAAYLQSPTNISKQRYLDMFTERFRPQVEALGYDYENDIAGLLTLSPSTETIIKK